MFCPICGHKDFMEIRESGAIKGIVCCKCKHKIQKQHQSKQEELPNIPNEGQYHNWIGKACLFWDEDYDAKVILLLGGVNLSEQKPFSGVMASNDDVWKKEYKQCIPLTNEQCIMLMRKM